eukprot:NODE_16_length_49026_cov_1.035992.p17 type:complete len:186 gc:universal NODE_16_length_49026_cov_1.035992:2746-2189(-)
MSNIFTTQEMVAYYFGFDEVLDNDNRRKCRCGVKIKKMDGKGPANFVNHIKNKHKLYEQEMMGNTLQHRIFTDKGKNVYKWMKWVIIENLPFTFVESEFTRSCTNLYPVSKKTLRKYIELVVPNVEKKIADGSPDAFGICFDGWKSYSNHYVGIFVLYFDGRILIFCQFLFLRILKPKMQTIVRT